MAPIARALLTAVLLVALAVPAFADVTLKQTISGKGMGMASGGSTVTYIKGMKMRSDLVTGDTTRTTIFDVESQKMYIFDNKKKEADVWDMAAFNAEISKSVEMGEMKASVKPNGQTKQVAGRTANGYDLEISMPATMGGQGGMKMTVLLTGPAWIVKGAPGTEDYLGFYKAAVERGFIFSDPRAAKGSPGQAKAMAEMYGQLAATGGIVYEQETTIKMSGEGPMAGLMAKMGGMTMSNTVESVETGTLAPEMFAPPVGYKLNARK
jgi:hypothetical protein